MTSSDYLQWIIGPVLAALVWGIVQPFMNVLSTELIASWKNRSKADDMGTHKNRKRITIFSGIWLAVALVSIWLLSAFSVWRFNRVTRRDYPSPLDSQDVSDLISVHINLHFTLLVFIFVHVGLLFAWFGLRPLKKAIQEFVETYAEKEQALRDFAEKVQADLSSLQSQTGNPTPEATEHQAKKETRGQAEAGEEGSGKAGGEDAAR